MKVSLRLLAVVLCVAGAGCTSGASRPPRFGVEGWRQAVEDRGVDPNQAVYPYLATPDMVEWVDEFGERYGRMTPVTRLRQLQEVLFDSREFPFEYDERLTSTAADAFASRRGNCMAFTALFIALSRAMGVETFLVAVTRPPDVERQDDLVVVNRHVVAGYVDAGQLLLFDFYITSEAPYVTRRLIDDVRASAMYHTNIGGSAIREHDLVTARQHLGLAVSLDPTLVPAWVNLGVARYRSGDPTGSLQAYEQALRLKPGHSSALTNMAYVYQQQGREELARSALVAASKGSSTAFTLIALADAEMSRGNLDQARGYLYRARRRHGQEPAVFEALARLERRGGDSMRAIRYQERAAKLRRKQRS